MGQQGGGASVGEAQGCVLKWITLLRGVPLVSQAENWKVGVKSESAPPATRHSQQLSSTAPGFFSVSLFCSLTHLLSFTLTHTHTHKHTHQPSLLAERRRDHRRTVKHLYCYSPSSSAIAMPRMWTLILGVMLGLLASSRSEIQGEEIVPFPSGFRFVWGFIFLILPKFTGLSGSRSFWKDFNQTLLLLCGKRHHLKERDSTLLLVECMCRCRRDSVSNTSTDSLAVRDSW